LGIILHIGAHHTGSTMVSQSVTSTIALHPDCGVALWGLRYLREIPGFQATTQLVDNDMCFVDEKAVIRLDHLTSFVAFEFAKERAQGHHTLILFVENFIGGMRDNSETGEFYPYVMHRLVAFDSLLPVSPVQVALGVRKYSAVWTSTFDYKWQSGREVSDSERAHSTLLNKRGSWPEVANAAITAWSGVRFLMWQQEHKVVSGRQICLQIIGLSADKIVIASGIVNARKSTTARPIVFSSKERKTLSYSYNYDLRRIQSGESIQWIGVA
jgi:hypothetical protein